MKHRDWKSSPLVVWIYNLPTFRGFASQDWQYCKSKPLKGKISNLCISFYEESYSLLNMKLKSLKVFENAYIHFEDYLVFCTFY